MAIIALWAGGFKRAGFYIFWTLTGRPRLSEDEAHELVLQTIWGAAKMLRQGTAQPSALRRAVTSKGGTTEAALAVFAAGDLSGVIARGVQAAYRRGGEIRRTLAAEDPAASPGLISHRAVNGL